MSDTPPADPNATPPADPNAPPADPNAPPADPNAAPPVDPNAPPADPNAPPVDPNATPPTDPNAPPADPNAPPSDPAPSNPSDPNDPNYDPTKDPNSPVYDPTRDPNSPLYDPTKDPNSPLYDPTRDPNSPLYNPVIDPNSPLYDPTKDPNSPLYDPNAAPQPSGPVQAIIRRLAYNASPMDEESLALDMDKNAMPVPHMQVECGSVAAGRLLIAELSLGQALPDGNLGYWAFRCYVAEGPDGAGTVIDETVFPVNGFPFRPFAKFTIPTSQDFNNLTVWIEAFLSQGSGTLLVSGSQPERIHSYLAVVDYGPLN